MGTTFERTALYEEVWSEPLTKLGKKYGLSDNGLRKICKAMNIPLPAAGHWAKVFAGPQVLKTPLPTDAKCTSYTSHAPGQANTAFHLPEDDAWLVEQDAYEERVEGAISVELSPVRWHRVAIKLSETIANRLKEVQQWRQLAERASNRTLRQRSQNPDFDSWRWDSFVRDGKLVMHASLRVSQETYERALKIVNAVFYAAEARGFTISMNADESRIELKGHGGTVSMRMTERLDDKIRREAGYANGPLTNKEIKVPTGSLRLFVDSRGGSESNAASDDNKGKIESKLNRVFLRINRLIIRNRELDRRHEAWNREWKEREERRATAARRKAIARKRRRMLHHEVRRWERATRIRQYVAQIVAANSELTANRIATRRLDRWQNWANELANRLDPTARRLGRFHGALGTPARQAIEHQTPGEIVIPRSIVD
jgi:hypothetical protein